MKLLMTEYDFKLHLEENSGYCLDCNGVTQTGVEPDATEYECDDCGHFQVMGVSMALVNGYIKITEETNE